MATGQIELQIKRVEFVTAVVVAISVVVGAVVSGVAWLAVKIDNLNNEKPFEGIWQASATYTKLHGISGKWSGTGEAIIVWQESEQRYRIYYGGDVINNNANSALALTLSLFVVGYIRANDNRTPFDTHNFKIEASKFIARMSVDGSQPSGPPKYKDCRSILDKGRAISFTCTLDSNATDSRVEFTRISQLH